MTISLSDGAAQDLLETGYDPIFNNGIIEGWTGARPANANAAPTGTKVATGNVPADAFAAAVGRNKAKQGAWSMVGTAAAGAGSVIGYYRLRLAGDTGALSTTDKRQDGTVTETGLGGDMTVDNSNVATGQVITINTFGIAIG